MHGRPQVHAQIQRPPDHLAVLDFDLERALFDFLVRSCRRRSGGFVVAVAGGRGRRLWSRRRRCDWHGRGGIAGARVAPPTSGKDQSECEKGCCDSRRRADPGRPCGREPGIESPRSAHLARLEKAGHISGADPVGSSNRSTGRGELGYLAESGVVEEGYGQRNVHVEQLLGHGLPLGVEPQ